MRRRSREQAVQVLFQIDLGGGAPADVLDGFWTTQAADDAGREFVERLVHGVCAERAELDHWIVGSARHWRIERMPAVDRNVLRVGVYELLHDPTPPAVVIDEAIEIARKYGTGDSGAFVNGVLDAIRRRLERKRAEAGRLDESLSSTS